MAQSLTTDAGTLIIPGAYSQIKVQSANSGLATTGILMLVGEADVGPRFSLESDLESNSFGPDELAAVTAKYKSGPLVDAFRAAAAPANDANITGSPNRMILVKTNTSTKASGIIQNQASGTYGTLFDKSYGKLGNLIYTKVTAQTAEVVPSTGTITYAPAVGSVSINFRVNGGSAIGTTLSANLQPPAAVSQIDALSGVAATGGVDRALLANTTGTLVVTQNPGGTAGTLVIDVVRSGNWDTQPVIGDALVIPTGSAVAGAGNANVGSYVVTASTATTLRAIKLNDAGRTGAVANSTPTTPVDVGSVAIGATTAVQAFSPVIISVEGLTVVDGIGKSLEICETLAGTDLLSRVAYTLGTAAAATWISKSTGAKLLVSASEYKANLSVNRQTDNTNESLIAGGEIALKIGYIGTTSTVTVTATTLTTTVTGGSGGNLSIVLADFPTIADLATYINSQTGYSCSVGTAVLGNLPSLALDDVTTAGICSEFGVQNGRIKIDAYRMFAQIRDTSVLVQLNSPAVAANSGLPKVTTGFSYLSGGARGGSTDADFAAAFTALNAVRGNFVVPLVSRDASKDIVDGLTDSTSTYTIDAVNAGAKSHCLAMSTLKKGRNRQAFCSIEDTFTNAKNAAANLASFRVSLAFQDFKQTNSAGSLVQFQPWMGSALAAGMQAAGFYRALVNKGINTSGVLSRDGSFSDKEDSQVEDALTAGLLPARKSLTGGFTWISDQTTYGKDNNFVFNSIQAVYVADIIATTTALRMNAAFVGQSVADVSAGIALSYLEGIMATFKDLKLISVSDDAPKGFKNAKVQISGPAMIVSVEVKLAGAIYFIPITFLVSPVTQTA